MGSTSRFSRWYSQATLAPKALLSGNVADNPRLHSLRIARFFVSKKAVIHVTFLALIALIAWQSRTALGVDRDSLLHTLLSGEEVAEGPLDPSAYAQTDGPGIGGARLAAVNIEGGAFDLITDDDAEVTFSQTLGGTALLAQPQPQVPEPGSDERASATPKKPRIYTVAEGDTVTSIAAQFDISENTILWANGLSGRDTIKKNDHLTIPPTTGVLHTVDSGDTLLAIGQTYDVDAKEIGEYNGLADNHKLAIGQKLMVPGGQITPRRAPQVIASANDPVVDDSRPTPPPLDVTSPGMIRPVAGYISQAFGRWGHTGADIAGNGGQTIYSAAAGVVSFVGRLGGYGNLVIVDHGSGVETYYAHMSAVYAKKGQAMGQGGAIGIVGRTGRATGDHLHFELRKGGRPINPCSAIAC